MSKTMTAAQVKALPKGEHQIDRGLRLKARGNGTGGWQVRYRFGGKSHALAIGDFPSVSLADAREKAAETRAKARAGIDPKAEKEAAQEAAKSAVRTFRDVAEEALPTFKAGWKCGGTRNGFIAKLETYLLPALGDKALAEITAADLRDMVKSMWHDKHPTADKCLTHMSKILKWAAAKGYPCDRMAVKDARELLGKTFYKSTPHAAFDWREAPAHFQSLGGSMSDLGEAFLMLTGVRAGNAQFARWDQIDRKSWVWTVPAHDGKGDPQGTSKNGLTHEVPLPRQAVAILGRAKRFYDLPTGYVFKSDTATKTGVVSANNWSKKLRDAGIDATAHGHRSAFKTWAEENAIEDSRVIEEITMHKVRKAQEAPYLRSQMLKRRRAALQKWADLLDGTTPVSFYDDGESAEIIDFDSVFRSA